MSKIEDLNNARHKLRELARIAQSTRQILSIIIQEKYLPDRFSGKVSQPGRLHDTLEHIGEVREGFILSQRTPTHVSLSELRALIEYVLMDWNWLDELNLVLDPGTEIESPSQQLLAYNHALVALGALPRLPAEAITFPQTRPTYEDVTPPSLPGEMLERIEEIEQVIYQAEMMPTQRLAYDPLRRTYAFFEASSWLVDNYLNPLLDS